MSSTSILAALSVPPCPLFTSKPLALACQRAKYNDLLPLDGFPVNDMVPSSLQKDQMQLKSGSAAARLFESVNLFHTNEFALSSIQAGVQIHTHHQDNPLNLPMCFVVLSGSVTFTPSSSMTFAPSSSACTLSRIRRGQWTLVGSSSSFPVPDIRAAEDTTIASALFLSMSMFEFWFYDRVYSRAFGQLYPTLLSRHAQGVLKDVWSRFVSSLGLALFVEYSELCARQAEMEVQFKPVFELLFLTPTNAVAKALFEYMSRDDWNDEEASVSNKRKRVAEHSIHESHRQAPCAAVQIPMPSPLMLHPSTSFPAPSPLSVLSFQRPVHDKVSLVNSDEEEASSSDDGNENEILASSGDEDEEEKKLHPKTKCLSETDHFRLSSIQSILHILQSLDPSRYPSVGVIDRNNIPSMRQWGAHVSLLPFLVDFICPCCGGQPVQYITYVDSHVRTKKNQGLGFKIVLAEFLQLFPQVLRVYLVHVRRCYMQWLHGKGKLMKKIRPLGYFKTLFQDPDVLDKQSFGQLIQKSQDTPDLYTDARQREWRELLDQRDRIGKPYVYLSYPNSFQRSNM